MPDVRPRNKQQQRLWGCGESANFASNTKCRNCGRLAPRTIVNRQREAARLPIRTYEASPGRQTNGAGDSSHQIAKQLEEPRKENAALRPKAAEKPEEIANEDADMGQKEDYGRTDSQLVEALASKEKALGTDHACAVQLRELLAKRRSEKQAALQPDVRLRHAQTKTKKLAKAVASDAQSAAHIQVDEVN